jgi:hypothetical protein
MRCFLRSVGHSLVALPLTLVCAAILFSSYVEVANAYIDPTAGGTLVQFLMGGVVAGTLMLVRLYWHNLRSWLAIGKRRGQPTDDNTEQADASPDA